MKQSVSPIVMVVVVVLVLAVVVVVGYKALNPGPDDPGAPTPEQMKQHMMGGQGGGSNGGSARPGGPGVGASYQQRQSGPPSGFGGR